MSSSYERIIFDIETAPMSGAESYVQVGRPPKSYKSADAIARWTDKAMKKATEETSLDPDLCRIVALAYASDQDHEVQSFVAKDEYQEKDLLERWWSRLRDGGTTAVRHTVGFNVLEFDWPIILRRCLYLGVRNPGISINRYRHPQITDLKRVLDFDGLFRFTKGRTLGFYLKRFNIEHADDVKGQDVPGHVAAGEWDKVKSHIEADVRGTLDLAERIGEANSPVIF